MAKFSRLAMARPPEMMILAEASSGRSDLASASPLKLEMPGSAAAGTVSIGAVAVAPTNREIVCE